MSIPVFDWADNLAIDIIGDIRGRTFADALDLVASRLRLLRQEGVCDGVNQAARVVQETFGGSRNSDATLQAEHQADRDEERENGWAAA